MTLRRQLLVVSLLLLTLPWAGCQFVREMEGALRQGQAQALQATAGAVAAFLESEPTLLYPEPARRLSFADARSGIYAFPTQSPVIVDGYGDGWEDIPGGRFTHPGKAVPAMAYQAQTQDGYLYLLLRVRDADVMYENPGVAGAANGDRLLLRTWQDDRPVDFIIATAAPGSVRARAGGRIPAHLDPARVRGYWQDAVGGYTLELELPLAYTGGRLGLLVYDVSVEAGPTELTVGNIQTRAAAAPPWLVYRPDALAQKLAPFSARSGRVQVVDRERWLIADVLPAQPSEENRPETFWLLRALYRGILRTDDLTRLPTSEHIGQLHAAEIEAALAGTPAQQRYADPRAGGRSLLSAAAPIRDAHGVLGAVVVRQSGETYLGLTDQAFSRLFALSIGALGIAAFGLLAYATLLSWRIRRLSRAVSAAVTDDGRVTGTVPRSAARDEIGELARRYADLLARLGEHNAYLRNLSRTLSHELRTPIAVIQSSLENLEHAGPGDRERDTYLRRAREGLRRLQHMLTAMSEASRLEESIQNQEHTRLDLVPLVRDVFAAYRSLYPARRLSLDIEPATAPIDGVAELIVQALDKLMDNAAAFSGPDGRIEMRLSTGANAWRLQVSNEGPPLPTDALQRIFEPMVSLRKSTDNAVHLGLGLHIVRLIADAHGARVQAYNLPNEAGVAVTLELPAIA